MGAVDRRAPALAALLFSAVATVGATALEGRLPASEDSVAGWALQVLGHVAAVAGGVLLLTTDGHPGRRSGAVVLGAVLVLVLTDAVALAEDDGGANIGLGGVRLLALLAVAAVALRLAPAVARDRRSGPSAPRA